MAAPMPDGIRSHACILDQHMLFDPLPQIAEKLTKNDPVGISRVPIHERIKTVNKAAVILLMAHQVWISAGNHNLIFVREVHLVIGNQPLADID